MENNSGNGKWINERFARVDDRIERIEKVLEKIGDNSTWIVRLVIGALITLIIHAAISFVQMGGAQ